MAGCRCRVNCPVAARMEPIWPTRCFARNSPRPRPRPRCHRCRRPVCRRIRAFCPATRRIRQRKPAVFAANPFAASAWNSTVMFVRLIAGSVRKDRDGLAGYAKQRAVIEARVAWVGALILRPPFPGGRSCGRMELVHIFRLASARHLFGETSPRRPGAVLSIPGSQPGAFNQGKPNDLVRFGGTKATVVGRLEFGNPRAGPLNATQGEIEEPARLYPEPHVIATANDLWILFPGTSRSTTGAAAPAKQEIPLNPPFFGMAQSDSGMTVISSDESGQPNHDPHWRSPTARFNPSRLNPPAPWHRHPRASRNHPPLRYPTTARATRRWRSWRKPPGQGKDKLGDKFVPDGANVVQMKWI